jgi:hypothetical protein
MLSSIHMTSAYRNANTFMVEKQFFASVVLTQEIYLCAIPDLKTSS